MVDDLPVKTLSARFSDELYKAILEYAKEKGFISPAKYMRSFYPS